MSYKNLLFFNKSGHQTNLIWNGDFWEARLMLPTVSVDLFEIEHFFIVEKFKNSQGDIVYGYPHISPDTSGTTSASKIFGSFNAGSNKIITDVSPLASYVGAKVFCSQFPNGNEITSVDVNSNTITLANPATYKESNVPLIFNLWKASFETTRNVLDFDTFPSFKADIVKGKDYITTNTDLTGIKENSDYLMILGNGIPKDARITSVSGKNIHLNKICDVSIKDTTVFVYPVEERNDVSNYIFQYELLEDQTLDAPVLNSLQESYIKIGYDSTESVIDNVRNTNSIDSSSVSINVALRSDEEGIFGRTLVIEDLSLGYPKIIARIEIHGETIGEDERYKTMLANFGRRLNSEDSFILRDSDPKEPYTDYEIVNAKRKELLLEGHEIFPYLGSYKGLINAIRFFGYQDLRVKEYWLNIKKSDTTTSALKENSDFVEKIKAEPKSQSTLIGSLLDDENSGKYKQVEIYGKKNDGTYGLKSPIENLFPSSSFKKTSLFGLFYDINVVVDEEFDQYGYPVVENAFVFSPDEVLMKLFGLKEKLKKDYLPLNARIIDITGEGVYFGIYKTRAWIDNLKIDELNQGLDIEIKASPEYGYVEDLRPFGIRPNKTIPYVPFIGSSPSTYKYSNYGNTVQPIPANPVLSGRDSKRLADAITNFYYERNYLGVDKFRLGDGDSKNGGYYKLFDGQKYEVPAGFPTALEVTSFILTWDEITNKWDALDRNVSTYSTQLSSVSDITNYTGGTYIDSALSFTFDLSTIFGTVFTVILPSGITFLNPSTGKVQIKFTSIDDSTCYFVAEVQTYDITTGIADLKLLHVKKEGIFDTWDVELTNLFSDNLSLEYYDYSFNADGFYSWDNLRFAGFYEIEWTVEKKDDNPFYYEFRGRLSDYYKIPVVLPYDGIYSVKCRVWDGFNDICSVYYENYIEVKKRDIELANVARFRETEVYSWENSKRDWNSYNSMWLYPVEGNSKIKISNQVLNFSEYGNQYNEGQDCKVLKQFGETIATAPGKFGLQTIPLSSFTSNYPGGGIGPAILTLNSSYLPHEFVEGEKITLIDNYNPILSSLSGTYRITRVTSTGFSIPVILSGSVTASQFSVIKSGSITVNYKGKKHAKVDFNGRLDTTLGNLMSALNNAKKNPSFGIDTVTVSSFFNPTVQEWMDVTFKAPIGSGNLYNGETLEIVTTGGIYCYDGISPVKSTSLLIDGGANSYSDYVTYNFNGDLPVENLRYYGTKNLDWDAFDALEWNNLYSQTWQLYDYHNDWLGGFSLYNLQSGDKIKVGIDTKGIVLGNTSSPDYSLGYLDLREAADQLNASKEPGISKFYYDVRGFSKLQGSFRPNGLIRSDKEFIATALQTDFYYEYTVDHIEVYVNGTKLTGLQYSAYDGNLIYISNPLTAGDVVKIVDLPLSCIASPYNGSTESYDVQPGASPGTGAPTSIVQDKDGDIVMGGLNNVTVFKSPTEIDTYYISSEYPGSIPRKVQTDEYHNWWCYGERCDVPLVIYNKQHPERTRIVSSVPVSGFGRPDLNLIVNVPDTRFQVIALAVDNLTDNFVMYIKYYQSYTLALPDAVFRLVEYNASTQEFVGISTLGPQWLGTKTYDVGSIVSFQGKSYISLTAANLTKYPATHPSNWELIYQENIGVIDVTAISIRQMKFEYVGNKSKLWMATNDGIKVYNGVNIKTLKTGNSGLDSNDTYAITFDEVGGKWIGTSNGVFYFDGGRWGGWTNASVPSLPVGKTRNIVNLKNGRIFYIVQTGPGTYKLVYFNGIEFKVYDNDLGTSVQFSPGSSLDYDYEETYFFANNVKSISGSYTRYVGDLFYLGDVVRSGSPYVVASYWDPTYVGTYNLSQNVYVRKMNYTIPYIHASAKTPGTSGWDFIYHLSYRPVPDPIYVKNKGLGTVEVNFNLIVGPLYTSSVNIGKDPQLPYVDKKSWKIPSWIKYDFENVIDSHPQINADDLFLDAPLRDIISGKTSQESYWRNSNVIRSAQRDKGNIVDSFEWVIKIGDSYDDRGIKTFIDEEGFVYVTGYFKGVVTFGSSNNIASGTANTTETSNNCQSIFVAKYNQFGVIQWVRKYGDAGVANDYDYTPTGIKVDYLGNIIVVGQKNKNRSIVSATPDLPSNVYVKWDWNADLVTATTLFSPSSSSIDDVIKDLAIDHAGNVYVTGVFNGTLSSGLNSITSTGSDPEVFVSRIEGDGNIKWINKIGSGGSETSPAIQIGYAYEDLYVTLNANYGSSQEILLRRYSSYDFNLDWSKSIVNQNYSNVLTQPHIKISSNGEIAMGATFAGNLLVEDINIESEGSTDIAIFKFNGYKALWGKNVGSTTSDYCQDVDIDSEGSIFVLGSYGASLIASPEFSSPYYYPAPQGNLDLVMLKYSKVGVLLDIVDAGGIAKDEGISLSIDAEDNIYLTGYISGQAQFSNWIASPSGGEDAFIGKISNLRYQKGNKIGNPFSWFGSGAWTNGEAKLFAKEFEVPIGTTVVFNPIDSFIPGKKNHVWKLIKGETEEELINIKDTPSFIWTFNQPGFYDLYASIEDSNGNKSILDKKGYVRVIDHKNPAPGEIVDTVTSDTFRRRAIYEPITKGVLL